jgi:hypothetical protein
VSIEAWLDYAESRRPGLKERDAEALLAAIRDFAARSPPPRRPEFQLERTIFFERLREEVNLSLVSGSTTLPDDPDAPLRAGESWASLKRQMLVRLLACELGEQRGWRPTDEERNDLVRRFRRQSGLAAPDTMQAWMGIEGVTDKVFRRFIDDELLIERFERLYEDEIESGLADQLRLATPREWLALPGVAKSR